MKNTITVAELARQLQKAIELGYADAPVVYFSNDEMIEEIGQGIWDVWPDGTIALG